MAQEPIQSVSNSPGFVTFAKCFCINPVYAEGYYKKRKGWVLLDLVTRTETTFKRLRDAKHHLFRLYREPVPDRPGKAGPEDVK